MFLGDTEISKAYLGDTLVFQEGSGPEPVETMTLIRHWDGTDALTSSKWYDKVGNQYYTLTNSTHGSGYYELLNSSPNSAAAYGTLNGTLPDMGYHWKIVAEVEVKVNTNNTAMVPIDFGSIGPVGSGKCAVCIQFGVGSHKWGIGAKFDGNSSASTYNPDYTNTLDPDFENGVWIKRTITLGVKESSSDSTKDVAYINVSDVGYGETPTPFTPLRFNRWDTGNYLARSRNKPSSSNKYATSVRIYDLKVYYEPVV